MIRMNELKNKLENLGLPITGKKAELQERLGNYLLNNSKIVHPSEEQKEIIRLVQNNKNITADCVAGSGKTTTILQIAHFLKKKNIISITYNAQLKNEVKNKVDEYNLKNIDVTNYHSLAVAYYNPKAYNDEELCK